MNVFQRFFSWILSIFIKPKPPKPIKPKECSICKIELGTLDRFTCKYCNNHYCTKHRLPEQHDCSGLIKK